MLARVTQAQNRYEAAKAQAEKLRNTGAVAMAAGTGGLYAAQRMMAPAMEFEQHGAVIAAGSGKAQRMAHVTLTSSVTYRLTVSLILPVLRRP